MFSPSSQQMNALHPLKLPTLPPTPICPPTPIPHPPTLPSFGPVNVLTLTELSSLRVASLSTLRVASLSTLAVKADSGKKRKCCLNRNLVAGVPSILIYWTRAPVTSPNHRPETAQAWMRSLSAKSSPEIFIPLSSVFFAFRFAVVTGRKTTRDQRRKGPGVRAR